MGLVASVGSKAMQPPAPPTYALVPDGQAWRFDDDWSPQNNYRNGCPIVFATGSGRTASLAHTVTLRLAGGNREIALLHVYSTEPSPTRPTLLYSKGRSFDMGQLRFHCVQLAASLDVNVLYYDYSGYGFNRLGVKPSVSATLDDAKAAAAYLEHELGVPPSQTILYGFSLGNGPTAYLAGDLLRGRGLRGVVLRSAFISGVAAATDVIQKHAMSYAPVGALPSFLDVWPVERLCGRFDAPTLVVHGGQDELLSPWHAGRLLKALPEECRVDPFLRDDMGHFDVERRPDYLERLRTFVYDETAV